ncbi:hypothetical protein A3709_19180 [Halioglobus sp. HI00S01]|nr:hypothetical protein A3709_19180 [Halioglobus sp. HI00S01]
MSDYRPADRGAFDETQAADYIASHGNGDPTADGIALARKLFANGSTYAEIGHEVVFRGLTE